MPVNSLFLKQNLRIWAEIKDLNRRYAKMPVNFPVPAKFAASAFGFRLFWWLYRASVGRGRFLRHSSHARTAAPEGNFYITLRTIEVGKFTRFCAANPHLERS
jgi:hypothetical protein